VHAPRLPAGDAVVDMHISATHHTNMEGVCESE
jgi:hypothetical protein